jgi:diguanylate cyclase (GGDEF)-like protein
MFTSALSALFRFPRLPRFGGLGNPRCVGALFVALMACQALSLLVLGTGRAGCGLAESILVLANLLALACAWLVFRRAQGTIAMFWFLFAAVLVVWLVPTAFHAYDIVFDQNTFSDSAWRLLYCLYGAPILMMLFLPDTYRRARVRSEIFLDLFQIAIVVGLVYSTFFFLPAQQMLPADALLRNVSISDAQSLLLLVAVLVRLQFARVPSTRNLLLRLGLILLVCAVATFIGYWIDLHHYVSAAAWFNLGWTINMAAAGLIAITWAPSPAPESTPERVNFLSFLGTNLVLVTMLSCVALLTDRWKQAHGETFTNVAIAASLLAFTFRLALTQFHQQQEIQQREATQCELFAANETIGGLLEESRAHASAIAQISELGSLLQACASRDEAFRIIPERMRRLFPGTSGAVSLLSASKNRVESQVEWGPCAPADHIFAPAECWALRRGCSHVQPCGESALRCPNLVADGASVCLPLIANGEALGVLAIQDNEFTTCDTGSPEQSPPWRPLATAAAEHIALALSNLSLREALRVQAVHDPLTGLYNRRYMQEFLERELQRSQRQRRPLSVLMLDLDNFKRYNDLFGHAAGDDILRALGDTLLHSIRSDDIACRYGGEEFVIVLPECPLAQATGRAEEICRRIKQTTAPRPGEVRDPVTISVGVAAYDENVANTVAQLLKFADEALYQAKHEGRDRVVVAQSMSVVAHA